MRKWRILNEKLKHLRKKRNALKQRTLQAKSPPSLPKDPVEFAQQLLKFKPYEYQAKLLRDNSKRIAVRWSRQAGKTTCIASRAIWYAVTYPGTLTLI